jgi:tight adherence protein B
MVDIPMRTLLAALAVFAAVALAVVALSIVVERLAEGRRRKELAAQLRALDASPAAAGSVLQGADARDIPWLRPFMDRLPHLRDVELMLQQAALPWGVQRYLLLTGGLGLALGLGGVIAFGLGVVAAILAGVGASFPYLYVRHKRAQRLDRFEEQFADTVDLIGRAIRAGHPLSAGFRMVAEEGHDPVAGEFRQVFEEQRFGLPFEDTLVALADRIPLVDVRILVTAVLIQREVGGNLAEILDKIAHMIRQRFTIRRQLRVITAEARMSMWVLLALPPGMMLIIYLIHASYITTLFTDPMGHRMLYASLVMSVLGYLWIRKIVDIEI